MALLNFSSRAITDRIALVPTMVMLISIYLCVLYLGFEAQQLNKKILQENLAQMVRYAATLVDMDAHRQIKHKNQTESELYSRTIEPLVLLHNSMPSIQYIYTLVVEGDRLFFVLDTANSPSLNSEGELEASAVWEEYDASGNNPEWIKTVSSGEVFVDPELVTDAFGTFISASAPLYDDRGEFVGLIGLDMNAVEYLNYKNRIIFRAAAAMLIGLLLSTMVGIRVRKNELLIEELQREQHKLTITDSLTGALNRRFFETQGLREWSLFQRHGESFALVSLDIDHFKAINDTHGHDAGDDCLVSFVNTVQNQLRKSDFFIRMGGEEFLALLPHTQSAGAVIVAEKIRKVVSEQVIRAGKGQGISFTVSIGISTAQQDDSTIEQVLKRSDDALYEAKNGGRNRVVVRDPEGIALVTTKQHIPAPLGAPDDELLFSDGTRGRA